MDTLERTNKKLNILIKKNIDFKTIKCNPLFIKYLYILYLTRAWGKGFIPVVDLFQHKITSGTKVTTADSAIMYLRQFHCKYSSSSDTN